MFPAEAAPRVNVLHTSWSCATGPIKVKERFCFFYLSFCSHPLSEVAHICSLHSRLLNLCSHLRQGEQSFCQPVKQRPGGTGPMDADHS